MRRRLLLFLTLFAACQGTSGGNLDLPDAAQNEEADGGGGSAPVLGAIQVTEVHAPFGDSGLVQGTLWEPDFTGFHSEVMNDGTCRLLTYEPSFCDPGCEVGMCIDGICREYPVIDAGALTVTGLAMGDVVVEPQEFPFAGYGYWAVLEQADLFAAGDPVTVSAPGADFPGFEMSAAGTSPLELVLENDEIAVPNGADYTFSWPSSPDNDAERLRLTLNSNNQTHGGPNLAIIECDVAAADGELTIPQAMIEMFPATEHWEACAGGDCPPSRALLYQRGTGGTADGGAVELRVGSEVVFYVVHPEP